ncbi:MAG: hypothetical protein L6R35_000965 [Caloplaca aegaea]|nr:MAG: hypothetical protein L6R35_000965 [Caloplaca aegaea]
MDYDTKPYLLPSNTSVEAYSHDVRSSAGARTARSSGENRHRICLKIEDENGNDIKPPGRPLHARPAASSAHAERCPRKPRRKPREDDLSILNFAGLGDAGRKSVKYLQYREKANQKAKDKNGQPSPWPEHMENAFQLGESAIARRKCSQLYPLYTYVDTSPALIAVPPMGKSKLLRGDPPKLCGRNELLSQRILLWTGELRTRKQISSHIQVLKGFMSDNEEWMKNVSLAEEVPPMPANPSIFNDIDFGMMKDEDIDRYARSCYGPLGQVVCSTGASLPPPVGILGSNAPGRGPFVNRLEFEMYIQSPLGEKIHDYTSNQTDIGAPPRALETVGNWRARYPRLNKYHEQNQLDSEIILIESKLHLLAKYPPKGSTLSIGFKANMAGVIGDRQWMTRADYYENNGQPVDMKSFYARNNIRKSVPWDTPSVRHGNGSDVQLEIPLQSTWWVQLFTRMAARKQETQHDPYLRRQEDEWSRRYLQEMSIMQEVWVQPGLNGASDSRLAIILWDFSQTRTGERATTAWRELRPPPERIKVDSPSHSPSPPLQHSMVLDSALQTLEMPQATSPNTERFLHSANLFAAGSERAVLEPHSARHSPSPAPSLDYTTSFPSSTTTSFPPSVTHGYLSHEESQDSACYSQESDRSRNGSQDAQYTLLYSQKPAYTYSEPSPYNDGLRYLSESRGAELPDQPYYSQPSFASSMPPYNCQSQYDSFDGELINDDSFAAHDFINGEIRLSLQRQDSLPNAHTVHDPHVACVQYPSEMGSRTNEQEFQSVSRAFNGSDPEAMAADQAHTSDFDFSTLETHFSPEILAALRAQDPGHHLEHSAIGDLLSSHSEMRDLNYYGLESPELVDGPSVPVTEDRFDDGGFVQVEPNAGLGEIEEEEERFEEVGHDELDDELAFDEVKYQESQAVGGGQGQYRGDGHYDDGGPRQEDAL